MPTVYQRRTRRGTKAKNFSTDVWIDGRKFPRSLQARTRRAAETEALAVEKELRAQLASRHEPLTIDTLMGKYRDHVRNLPSYKSDKYHMLRLVEILGPDKPLADLSNADVDVYVSKRCKMFVSSRAKDPKKRRPPRLVSHSTINRELDVLQAAYTRARDLWEHPVRAIKWGQHRLPPPGKAKIPLTVDQARAAVRLAQTRSLDVADAIELSVYTGARFNELKTLIPARVYLADRFMVVLAKRKARQAMRERKVFLSTPAVALLSERIAGLTPDAPVFVFRNSRKIWEWVRARIGRPDVRWHDLRHTHASMLGEGTKDPMVVKEQLGHGHLSTSMGYIHTADAAAIAGVETIPALTERKVRLLK